MKTPQKHLQLQSDCNEIDLPNFKTMPIKQQREYLKGWFGCDDCPVEFWQVYYSRAPVELTLLRKKRTLIYKQR